MSVSYRDPVKPREFKTIQFFYTCTVVQEVVTRFMCVKWGSSTSWTYSTVLGVFLYQIGEGGSKDFLFII